MARLSLSQEAELFKLLTTNNYFDAGVLMGIDKFRKTKVGIQDFVGKTKGKIVLDPAPYAKFGITTEIVDMVIRSSQERSRRGNDSTELSLFEKRLGYQDATIKELVDSGSKKSLQILNYKLDLLLNSKRKATEENIMTIAKIAGIMFDKRQISQGEATEHIAVYSKIKTDMTPEEKLKMLLQMRETMLDDER